MRRAAAVAALLACLTTASCSASPAPPPLSVTALPHGQSTVPPVTDSGPATDVDAVRTATRSALSAELRAADQEQDRRARYSGAARYAMLRTVETERRATSIVAALAHVDGQGNPRTGGRFAVERWQGITVRRDRAAALVLGHSAYTPTPASSQARDDTGQYQVLLVRQSGTWRVDAVRTVLLESG